MNLTDLLNRLDSVKGGNGQYMARCPAHDDKNASLSVGIGEDRRILLRCHAGCSAEAITAALGLSVKDLFPEDIPKRGGKSYAPIVATYHYPGGVEKLRKADKSFSWRQPDGRGGWDWHKPKGKLLYTRGDFRPGDTVIVVEGEKDADNLAALEYFTASGPDGAGPGKWKKNADTEPLRGCYVGVIPDHDQVGMDYAIETCNSLSGVAASVRLLDLAEIWPEIPEHGDVSDMVAALGDDEACTRLTELIGRAKEWEPKEEQEDNDLLSLFAPLSNFKEEEATWLVPGWIPEGQITLIAADGGVGKTTLWVHVIAALSSGKTCILDPPGHFREPQKVVFCTTEDSIRKKLLKKLREAGANMDNIMAMDMTADRTGALRGFKFGTKKMDSVLRHLKSTACIFDPVQGFVPPDINMGSRNAMRDCMAPLITIGEDVGTTFLVICHTNKRKGAYGRDRIADSADLWDIARSVIMAGYTETQGIRYLSNEKNNYTNLQETVLFSIDDSGQIQKEGTSFKRDRDYMLDSAAAKSAPKKEDCKSYILQALEEAGGSMTSDDLGDKLHTAGYAFKTINNSKRELKEEGKIKYFTTGSAKDKSRKWHVALIQDVELEELPQDTPVPFEEIPMEDLF